MSEMEAPEWADYSNASAAETFVAALEMLLAQWGLSDALQARPASPANSKLRFRADSEANGDHSERIIHQNKNSTTEDLNFRKDSISGELNRHGYAEVEGEDEDDDDLVEYRSEELPLGKDRYSVLYIPHPDGAFARVPVSPVEARLSLAEVMLLTTSPEFRPLEQPSTLEQLFGVAEYVVLSPTQRRANLNDVSLLLSSASLALPTCARPVPCFVPVPRGSTGDISSPVSSHEGSRNALKRRLQGVVYKLLPQLQKSTISYYGTWTASSESNPGTVIHFNSVEQRLGDVPKTLRSLSGICRLFRGKLGQHSLGSSNHGQKQNAGFNNRSNNEHSDKRLSSGDVLVSIRYTYEGRRHWNPHFLTNPSADAHTRATNWTEWHDSDLSWRLHLDHFGKPPAIIALRGGFGRPPLWGPLSDPIANVGLQILWPAFSDDQVVDNETICTLIPESAPTWVVEACIDAELQDSEVDYGNESLAPEDVYYGHNREADHDCEENSSASSSSEDKSVVENEATCPLSSSVRYLQIMVDASMSDHYRNALLSRLPQDEEDVEREYQQQHNKGYQTRMNNQSFDQQPGGPTQAPARAGRGARNTSLEEARIQGLIKDLFTSSPDAELPRTVLVQLQRLKQLYMEGSLTNHEFRDAKERILIEAGRAGPDLDYGMSSQWADESSAQFNVLQRPCPECWLCSPESCLKTHRVPATRAATSVKGAPEGSLLSVLALRIIPEFGASMSAASALWRAFVAELRWYWENAVLIPVNASSRNPLEPVDHQDCILHQKLALLNLCIAARAHAQFNHESRLDEVASLSNTGIAKAKGVELSGSVSGNRNDDCKGIAEDKNVYEGLEEEGSDTFFDAASSSPISPSHTAQTVGGLSVPWTIENSLMTEDMVRERTELMSSLALKQNTAALHKEMLSTSLRSEISAFKAANVEATFEDFKRFKGRTRMLGDFWRKLWDETEAMTLRDQVRQNPTLFVHAAEAEKILHFFETMSPNAALSDLFLVGLQSAIYVLKNAIDSFMNYPEIHSILARNLMMASSQLGRLDAVQSPKPGSPSRRGRALEQELKLQRLIRQAALDGLARTELLLSLAASLLHKFPPSVVESMLTEEEATGRLVATLEKSAIAERQHIRSLLFPESVMDSLSVPEPDRREYILRALARRGGFRGASSWVRPGANRMYVAMTHNSFVLATSLTETAFA